MAFVIVSAGHLTNSNLRTVRARWLLVAAGAGLLVLMVACVLAGYELARRTSPTASAEADRPEPPEIQALVQRVGQLAGRLVQLEGHAATLAKRLGIAPLSAILPDTTDTGSSGGPLIPAAGLDQLETDFLRLEDTFAQLSDTAIDLEVETMAFPNRLPVAGGGLSVSSNYGTRHDPFTGRLARHTGLDIPARHGTAILASGGGRVISAGYRGAYGQTVVIDHGDGLSTLYGHASRLLVRAGDVVMPQQKIGLVGSTGRSTGPHLHFEVIRNGRRVEPRTYLENVLEPSAIERQALRSEP